MCFPCMCLAAFSHQLHLFLSTSCVTAMPRRYVCLSRDTVTTLGLRKAKGSSSLRQTLLAVMQSLHLQPCTQSAAPATLHTVCCTCKFAHNLLHRMANLHFKPTGPAMHRCYYFKLCTAWVAVMALLLIAHTILISSAVKAAESRFSNLAKIQ